MTDSPSLLLELPPAPPQPDGLLRRWFTSPEMDLIAWSRGETVIAFQVCMGKPQAEQSLTWRVGQGFSAQAVDAGDVMGQGHKATPVLTVGAAIDRAQLRQALALAGAQVPAALLGFVDRQLAIPEHEA